MYFMYNVNVYLRTFFLPILWSMGCTMKAGFEGITKICLLYTFVFIWDSTYMAALLVGEQFGQKQL